MHSQIIEKEQMDGPSAKQRTVTGMLTPQQKPPIFKEHKRHFPSSWRAHISSNRTEKPNNKQANNELEKIYRWQKFP